MSPFQGEERGPTPLTRSRQFTSVIQGIVENNLRVFHTNRMDNQQNPSPSETTSANLPANSATPQAKTNVFLPMLLALVLCGVVFGIGGYYLGKQFVANEKQFNSGSEQNNLLSAGSSPYTTIPTSELALDPAWKTYAVYDVFSVQYPEDAEIRDIGNGVVITKYGSSQKSQTELNDGISLTITFSMYEANETPTSHTTLKDVAQGELELSKENADIVEGLNPVTVGSLSGYTYLTQGLGRFRHYILGTNFNTRVIYVVDGTTDPNNQGYNTITSRIINSIQTNTDN